MAESVAAASRPIQKPQTRQKGVTLEKAVYILKQMYKNKISLKALPTLINYFETGVLPHSYEAYELIACINRNVGKISLFTKYATYAYFIDKELRPPLDPGLDLSKLPEEIEGCQVRPAVPVGTGDQSEKKEEPVVEEEDLRPEDNVDYCEKLEEIIKSDDEIYRVLLNSGNKAEYNVEHNREKKELKGCCSIVVNWRAFAFANIEVAKRSSVGASVRLRRGDSIEIGSVMYNRAKNRAACECVRYLKDIRGQIEKQVRKRWKQGVESKLDRWRHGGYVGACEKAYHRARKIILHDDYGGLYGCEVLMFGSGAVGMLMSESDIDVTIIMGKWGEMEAKRRKEVAVGILMYLEKKAEKADMKHVYVVDTAKIPLLRYRDVEAEIDVDVSISDGDGVLLSRFIRRHLQADVRIWELCMMVKFWSKRREVCGTSEGLINPIGWTIMGIFFMQHVVQPSIGKLFEVKGKAGHESEIRRVGWRSAMKERRGEGNGESVARLVCRFFRYFGEEFDYGENAISINCQDLADGKELRGRRKQDAVFIEQPLHFGENVVGHVSRGRLEFTRSELRRAYALSMASGDVNRVCEQREVSE